jgi:predicted RNase H-like HicB family nuclease
VAGEGGTTAVRPFDYRVLRALADYDATVLAEPANQLPAVDHIVMSTSRTLLTPVYEEIEDGWVLARIAEVPEVVTQGRDRAEAEVMLRDALREYVGFLLDAGKPLPAGANRDARI